MARKQNSSVIEFAGELIKFCQTPGQGTVLFFKSEKEYGKLIIEGGEIVALNYRDKANEEALDVLDRVNAIRYHFHPYRLPPKKRIHLSLDEFFRRLGGLNLSDILNDAPILQRAQSEKIAADVSKSSVTDLSTALENIKNAFHSALGPISSFIYEEKFDAFKSLKSSEDMERFIDNLAQEIQQSEHQQEFRSKARQFVCRLF